MEKQRNSSTEHSRSVPKLRFPVFIGEWEKKKLGEVAEFKVTNSFSRENLNYENGVVKNIHYGDIHTKFQTLFDITKEEVPFINEEMNVKRILEDFYCKEGDIVFADASEDLNDVGKSIEIIHLNNEKLLSGLHTLLARPKEKIFSLGFNGYLFKSNNVRLQIQKEAQGSKVLSINVGRISNIYISFPTLPEQKRIASFFTVLDKKIAELKQKKTLLEQYKKGIMQKLFSQELRFKDENGKEFPNWVLEKLGEVAEIIMGQSPESKSYNTEGNGKPLIQGNADIQNRISNPRNWTTQTTKQCQIGDLILTVRAPVGAVSKSIHNACIGRGVCAIRNTKITNIEFLYQYLLDYETKWSSIEQGSTFTAVSGNEIKKLIINLPSFKEQTKIANFLSAIDEKLNRTENQIQQTQQYKKGLLQKMFV